MEWNTFIKWNVISYTAWYGANLLLDYLRFRRKVSDKTSDVQTWSVVLDEKPQEVNSKDFELPVDEPVPESRPPIDAQIIRFEAPVEHHGIPFQDFIQNAKQISQPFNF